MWSKRKNGKATTAKITKYFLEPKLIGNMMSANLIELGLYII